MALSLSFSADEVFLWWQEKAVKIIEKTAIDNGATPDLEAFTADFIQICEKALSAIKEREVRDATKAKIKHEKEVQKALDTVIDFFRPEHRMKSIKKLAESEGIRIESEEFFCTLLALDKTFLAFQVKQKEKRLKPETWLVVDAFPTLYAKHFEKTWGHSRAPGGGLPCGPGIRFMSACLDTLGIQKSPEAIVKLIRDHKK